MISCVPPHLRTCTASLVVSVPHQRVHLSQLMNLPRHGLITPKPEVRTMQVCTNVQGHVFFTVVSYGV